MIIARFGVIVFLISLISLSETYRILVIFPFNSRSHNGMFNALIRGLAKRNHQLDVITHFPLKNPPDNYKVILNLNGTIPKIVNNFTYEFVNQLSKDASHIIGKIYGNDLCELLGMDEIQKLIKYPPKNPPYDLFITEAFGANCYMGFGHLLKVPVVAVASIEFSWVNEFNGNSDNLAFVPDIFLTSRNFDRKSFWDRLNNFLSYHSNNRAFNLVTGETQTNLMRKYISPDMPHIREIEKSVALTLMNRHPLLNDPKPVISSLVEVSGLHVEKVPPKLPVELQKFLDESNDGVVYFTLGSMVLIETWPEHVVKTFYESFSKISPVKVLMKIPNPELLPPGLPKNVVTRPWMPQQAILAHKNVRAFITHGGMMSCQEALYHGVPILGIPLFADQPRNIETFKRRGMALELDTKNLTVSDLDNALYEILNNPKFRENAKTCAQLFNDRPVSAMETAIFWTEWVVRNDPKILKSPALQLKWWQLYLLDIYGFFLLIFITSVVSIYYIVKLLFKCFSTSSKKVKFQ